MAQVTSSCRSTKRCCKRYRINNRLLRAPHWIYLLLVRIFLLYKEYILARQQLPHCQVKVNWLDFSRAPFLQAHTKYESRFEQLCQHRLGLRFMKLLCRLQCTYPLWGDSEHDKVCTEQRQDRTLSISHSFQRTLHSLKCRSNSRQ